MFDYPLLHYLCLFCAAKGSTTVYEDDGQTTSYLTGAYAYTSLTYTRATSSSIAVKIETTGSKQFLKKKKQLNKKNTKE